MPRRGDALADTLSWRVLLNQNLLGAPGKRRPVIVALAQPKASALRLHQSNPAHQHRRGCELAEWVSSTHS